MKKVKNILLLFSIIIIISGCGNSGDSPTKNSESSKVSFKFSHQYSKNSTQGKAIERLSKSVSDQTEGNFEIKIYPNNELGGASEVIEGMQIGTVDMDIPPATNMANFYEPFYLSALPFLFENKEHVHEFHDGEVMKKIYEEAQKEIGIKTLGAMDAGFRGIGNTKREIKSPEDLKGLKLRTIESPLNIDIIKSIGATPTAIDWGEVYTALQQGTVDGLDQNIGNIEEQKIYELIDYYTDIQLYFAVNLVTVSESSWEKLSDEYQDILSESVEDAVEFQRELLEDEEKEFIKVFEDAGVKVTELNSEEKSVFRETVKPIWKEYEDIVGLENIEAAINSAP